MAEAPAGPGGWGEGAMTVSIRSAEAGDLGEAGRICHAAFHAIATAHGFAPDFPSREAATGALGGMIGKPGFFGVVAEEDGRILGSNFLDERSPISGIGPITVDPNIQNRGVGGLLMQAVMERSAAGGFAGVRLVQAGYHTRSLALYAKLGFEVREHLSCLQGSAIGRTMGGHAVRAATRDDIAACDTLCARVHGTHRGGELAGAVAQGVASVVERGGRITGYTSQIAFFGHAVGETNDDMIALISAASAFAGPGFIVPSRNGALLRWCLGQGLRITQSLTLMTIGLYNEPVGAYLPSVLY